MFIIVVPLQPTIPTHAISSLISSVAMPGPANILRGYPASRSFDDRGVCLLLPGFLDRLLNVHCL